MIGLGGAFLATAAPANAVLPSCANATDHTVASGETGTDNWYMTCIPKYGMGKTEFTITTDSDHPYPAGYSLDDGHQTAVTSTPLQSDVSAYFQPLWLVNHTGQPDTYTGAFLNLAETDHSSDGLSQTYGGGIGNDQQTMAFQVDTVGKTATLPTDCTNASPSPTYDGMYEITYDPTTTTFSETVNNVVHRVTVTFTPAPLFLGLNFDAVTTDADYRSGFDDSKPVCASSGGVTQFAASSASDPVSWSKAAEDSATNDAGYMSTIVPQPGSDFPPPNAIDAGLFTSTSTPILATTGVDAAPIGLAGGGLIAAGAVTYLLGRRRRRRRTSATR